MCHSSRGHGVVMDVNRNDDRGKPFTVQFQTVDTHSYSDEQLQNKFTLITWKGESTRHTEAASGPKPDPSTVSVGVHVCHRIRGHGVLVEVNRSDEREKPFVVRWWSSDLHSYSEEQLQEKFKVISNEKDGHANVCSKLFGTRAGVALDAWLCKWIRWLVAIFIVCTVLHRVTEDLMATLIASALSKALLSVPWALCLRASALAQMSRMLSMYYYVVSILARMVSSTLLFGPSFWSNKGYGDTRVAAYCMEECTIAFGLVVSLPMWDAAPDRLAPHKLRLLYLIFIAVYNAYLYSATKLGAAKLYSSAQYPPEWSVGSYVVLSALDVFGKSCLTISLLSLHGAYRTWRWPELAVLMQSGVPFSVLHGTGTRATTTSMPFALLHNTETRATEVP